MSITILRTLDEVKQCTQLYMDIFNAEPWNDSWNKATAFHRLEDCINSPGFIGIVYCVEDDVTGAIIGNIEHFYDGKYFNLKEMFVKNTMQRQGIGQQMFEFLTRTLQEYQISSINLFSSKEFFPYSFYKKHGFQKVSGMRMMNKVL